MIRLHLFFRGLFSESHFLLPADQNIGFLHQPPHGGIFHLLLPKIRKITNRNSFLYEENLQSPLVLHHIQRPPT